jgi:hypothetical protein
MNETLTDIKNTLAPGLSNKGGGAAHPFLSIWRSKWGDDGQEPVHFPFLHIASDEYILCGFCLKKSATDVDSDLKNI